MARRNQTNARKVELLNELTSHRLQIKVKKRILDQEIAAFSEQIKDTINVPKLITNKIKSSFNSDPTKWFIISTLGGLLITKFLFGSFGSKYKRNEENPKARRSIILALVGMVAKPIIKSYLVGKAQHFFAQKFLGHQQVSPEYDYQQYSDYDIR